MSKAVNRCHARTRACFAGTWCPIHLTDEGARAAGFTGRIVQGFLVYILAYTVLAQEMEFGSKPSNLELRMKFISPVYLGKAIYLRSLRVEPDAAGFRLPLVVESQARTCASGRLLWDS